MTDVLIWMISILGFVCLGFSVVIIIKCISMFKRTYTFYINGNKFEFVLSVMSSSQLLINGQVVDEQPHQYGNIPRTFHYEAEGLSIRINIGTKVWWPKFVFTVFVNNVKLPQIYGNGENITIDGITFPDSITPISTINVTLQQKDEI